MQIPWLFNATLKRNVCLNSVVDEVRFREVVDLCALGRDFELLPRAEETIVGEKGSALSGGQKVDRVLIYPYLYEGGRISLLCGYSNRKYLAVMSYIFFIISQHTLVTKRPASD